MPLSVRDVLDTFHRWAPAGSKYDFDRVGLQVGDPNAEVGRVLVALDLTPAVIDEAVEIGAELIVTHHPLIFRPLEHVRTDGFESGMVYRLAQHGIAYAAVHTNLDVAPGGVSFALAEMLGLEEVSFLEPRRDVLVKLVAFVPRDHADAVREALAEAGAGRIGDYDACAFTSEGTGHFRPGEGATPFTGTPGEMEHAPEVRLEVEVARWDLGRVTAALRSAHPYEEVAYDVYPVEQPHTRTGLGAVGTLPEPLPLSDFLALVADRLEADGLRYVGDDGRTVQRVAVCGGSGSSLIGKALAAGADAYVTADITYHTFFQPLDTSGRTRMALIDAGHYETEWVTERLLVDYLRQAFPNDLEVTRSSRRTSPIRTFART